MRLPQCARNGDHSVSLLCCSGPHLIVDRGSLDAAQRIEYINAVWCLRDKDAVLPVEEFPGVRDRLDDFVA